MVETLQCVLVATPVSSKAGSAEVGYSQTQSFSAADADSMEM